MSDMAFAPRFEVMITIVREKFTWRLSPRFSVALSSIPSRSCHGASEALSNLVEQHQLKARGSGAVMAGKVFL